MKRRWRQGGGDYNRGTAAAREGKGRRFGRPPGLPPCGGRWSLRHGGLALQRPEDLVQPHAGRVALRLGLLFLPPDRLQAVLLLPEGPDEPFAKFLLARPLAQRTEVVADALLLGVDLRPLGRELLQRLLEPG